MKSFSICASLAIVMLLLTGLAPAEDYAKPTKFHDAMEHEVGVWDADVSLWMEPGGDPQQSKAVETNEMLGKMWLLSKFEGEFGGQKFEGSVPISGKPYGCEAPNSAAAVAFAAT